MFSVISEYSPFALLLLQVKNTGSKPKKKVPAQKGLSESDYIDDDDALKQVHFNTSWIKIFFYIGRFRLNLCFSIDHQPTAAMMALHDCTERSMLIL